MTNGSKAFASTLHKLLHFLECKLTGANKVKSALELHGWD